MRYSYGPARSTMYERRKKQLGINNARNSLTPLPPPGSNRVVTQAGTGFNIITQAGDFVRTQ